MKFINKKFNIFTGGSYKWRWIIVIPLFAIIIILDFYSSLSSGEVTIKDYIYPFIFTVMVIFMSWDEDEGNNEKKDNK